MSTDIRNGYLLPPFTLMELQNFTLRMRESIAKVTKELVHSKAADLCAELIDTATLKGKEAAARKLAELDKEEDLSGRPINIAYWGMLRKEKEIQHSKERNPSFDFGFHACIIPTPDQLLAMIYTEQEAYISCWTKMEEVTPYPYWNSTDEPDGISRTEWKKRERTWDKALGKRGIPALVGFRVECYTGIPRFHPDDLVANMPSWEDRVMRHAKSELINNKMKELAGRDKVIIWSNAGRLFHQANDWIIKTEEGQAALEGAIELVRSSLKPVLSSEDIVQPLSTFISERRHST